MSKLQRHTNSASTPPVRPDREASAPSAARRLLLTRFGIIGAGGMLAGLAAQAAIDASWPRHAVRLVVPAPPGSSLDVIARTLSPWLAARWKHPVTVDNRPGAGGQIGVDSAAKSAPDGLTIAVGFNGPIAFGPFLYRKMMYDPARDLQPVVLTTSQPNVLAVQASLPVRTLGEFIDWAKHQKSGLTYASVGNGSASHLAMEMLRSSAGFDATHVPYPGSPPAAASVAAGDTQAVFSTEPALKPLVQSGKVRLLAATSAKRTETLPELPTIAESGFEGFDASAWNGLFVAKATPRAIVDRINADVNSALKDANVRKTLVDQGIVPSGGTVEQFEAYIDEERKRWEPVIRKAGVQVD